MKTTLFPFGSRPWLLLLAAALLLWAGCTGCIVKDDDAVDDDSNDDDDDSNDDDDDDDVIPVTPCVDVPNPAGLDSTVCADDAACRLAELHYTSYQGFSLAADGDFDGDGADDVAVGAPGYDEYQDEGIVMLYNLASFGEPIPVPVAAIQGPQILDMAGYSVAYAGDTDGDGFDDLLVGARSNTTGGEGAGAAYVIYGRELDSDVLNLQMLTFDSTIAGHEEYGRVGSEVGGILDATGDGLAEIAVPYNLRQETGGMEYPYDGAVAVFHGQAQGLANALWTTDADLILEAPWSASEVGCSVDGMGDITGDGLGDLLVGAPQADTGRGRMYIVPGDVLAGNGTVLIEDVSVIIYGADINEHLGEAVGYLGDVDGDGIDDVAVGASENEITWPDGGAVYVLKGSADVASGVAPTVLAQIGSEWDDFVFGGTLAGRGDVDGDGLGDLVVGATDAYLGPIMKGGRAYLFHGRESGWDSVVDATDADGSIAGIGVGDKLSYGMALGDLDGDGIDDIVVGAPYAATMGTYAGETYLFWGPTR